MSSSIARCAADRRAHDRAWGPDRVRERDGLSRFQHRVEAALRDAGYAIAERAVAPLRGGEPDDVYVTGRAGPSGVRLYVYRDGVELDAGDRSLRLDAADAAHPDDVIRATLDRLRVIG